MEEEVQLVENWRGQNKWDDSDCEVGCPRNQTKSIRVPSQLVWQNREASHSYRSPSAFIYLDVNVVEICDRVKFDACFFDCFHCFGSCEIVGR